VDREGQLLVIRGDKVHLRTVREPDLARLYEAVNDVEAQGEFAVPRLRSEPEFRKQFAETGFFGRDAGTYLVVDAEDRLLGDVVYFSVNYMAGYEMGYCLFDRAQRGRGLMTEALGLAVRNLFDTRPVNRLQICTSPDNEPSKRLALRCGFTFEARLRGHMFCRGRYEDSLLYSRLRVD
jgi:ribosomal-protein-alanine N-acetyltransferase